MRISDQMISASYLNSMNSTKQRLEQIRLQLALQSKINKPSDSPGGTAKILRFNKQIEASEIFIKNVQESSSYVNQTTFVLESIQTELEKVLVNMTEVNNASNTDLNLFADQIDLSLQSILDLANTEYDGKYIFGGTDHSGEPFGFSGSSYIEVKSGDVSGKQFVKTAPNITQKINMPGSEIFSTIIKQLGNLDTNDAAGAIHNAQTTIYDADGNPYTLNATFTKTAANTYDLTYDIVDGSSNSIFSSAPPAKEIVFNSTTGEIDTIDGKETSSLRINDAASKIDFHFELSSFKEKNAAFSSSYSANQQVDIFNSLIAIRDNLRAGIKPNAQQQDFIKAFNQKILSKTVEAGNISNQLLDAEELLDNQKLILQELVSKEKEVDVAKAVIDLQNYDYVLQLTYKMSAMVLPKSLLDYL